MGNFDDQPSSPEEIDLLVNGLVSEQTAAQESELDDHTEKITVHSIKFASFEQKDGIKQSEKRGMELLYDVPLQLSVELGRTEKTLREILDLSPGALIELNRSAGEPLNVLANGNLVAVGEVIVLDENYGIRIKGILNEEERLAKIGSRG